MNKAIAASLMGLIALSGCRGEDAKPNAEAPLETEVQPHAMDAPAAPQPQPVVVAHVEGRPITLDQLQNPLLEAYGLQVLLQLVQLELAKDTATKAGVAVSAEDLARERRITLESMFQQAEAEDYEKLLTQFLQQQNTSPQEFDIVLRTNAHLRKIIEPQLADKINEDALRQAFGTLYGETVQVRHIQLANTQEVHEAQRRLAAGESFEDVAKELSRNPRTAPLGGELPTFSRMTSSLAQSFRDVAFSLKPGEVSDPVQAEGAFHLIKMIQKFPPKAVNFEDHKDAVHRELLERMTQQAMKELRQQLAQQALQTMQIEHPELKRQFDERRAAGEAQVKDREQVRQELLRRREELARQRAAEDGPATLTTTPTTVPATQPR